MLLMRSVRSLIMMPTVRYPSPFTKAFTMVHQLSVQACPHQPCMRKMYLTIVCHVGLSHASIDSFCNQSAPQRPNHAVSISRLAEVVPIQCTHSQRWTFSASAI